MPALIELLQHDHSALGGVLELPGAAADRAMFQLHVAMSLEDQIAVTQLTVVELVAVENDGLILQGRILVHRHRHLLLGWLVGSLCLGILLFTKTILTDERRRGLPVDN